MEVHGGFRLNLDIYGAQGFPDFTQKYDSKILHTVGPVTVRFQKVALSQNEGPTMTYRHSMAITMGR